MANFERSVSEEIKKLQERVRALETGRRASYTTIDQNGMRVDAGAAILSTDFDGALPSTPGTVGWALGGAGAAAIFNEIILRDRIIGNNALANPVAADFFEGSGNATLIVAGSYLFTGSIPIPAGFTKAIVLCTGTVGGTNTSGGGDNLYCQPQIAGVNGEQIASGIPASFAHSVSASQAALLNPLSGSSIALKVWGATDFSGWTGGNGHLSAAAIFFR